MHGFETMFLPVTHPGVEQKATWLQIRQNRPDYVLLWGWGVMNSTAIKEAVAVGYPREKMYGVWWSGAEQDVRPAEDGAKGYNSAALQHTAGQFQLHQDLKKYLYGDQVGTTGLTYITNNIQPTQQPKVFDTLAEVSAALEAHRIDALITDTPTAQYMASAQLKHAVLVAQFPSVGDITFEAGFVITGVVYLAWHAITRSGAGSRAPAAVTPGR